MISKLLSKIRKIPDSLRLFFRSLLIRCFQQNQYVQKIKSFIIKHPFEVISIGLIIIIIVITAHVLERKKKRPLPKKKNICQACKGYGELITQVNGEKNKTTCPHCAGTGWTVEG